MPNGRARDKTKDCGPLVGSSTHVPPPQEPAACPVLLSESGVDLTLRHPIARHRLEVAGRLFDDSRIASVIVVVGDPTVVELMDHLGFIKRHTSLRAASRRSTNQCKTPFVTTTG